MRRLILLILITALLGLATSLGVAWVIAGLQPEWCAVKEVGSGTTAGWSVTEYRGLGQSLWWGNLIGEGDREDPLSVPSQTMFAMPPTFRGDQGTEHWVGWPALAWQVRWRRHPSYYGEYGGADLQGGLFLGGLRNTNPWTPTTQVLPFQARWPGALLDVSFWWMVWLTVGVLFAALGIARRWIRRKRNQCASCGYDLRGQESSKCSECGHEQGARRTVFGQGLIVWFSLVLLLVVFAEAAIAVHVANLAHGPHPIHFAARDGDLAGIELALQHGESVDVQVDGADDPDASTPLLWATAAGQIDAVQLLIERGADVDQADVYMASPLRKAAWHGHADVLSALLAAGAKVNAADQNGLTALHEAIAGEASEECVRLLIVAGADVNGEAQFHATPLCYAAGFGCADIARLLIAAGADVSIPEYGGPLECAVSNGYVEVVRVLLDAGAPMNLSWGNLVDEAVSEHHADVLKLLLDHGAPRPEEELNWTLLHVAVNAGDTETVRVLVEAGFDPTLHGGGERTPLQMAIDIGELNKGYEEIIAILRKGERDWKTAHPDEPEP